jgi:hypothetical protein
MIIEKVVERALGSRWIWDIFFILVQKITKANSTNMFGYSEWIYGALSGGCGSSMVQECLRI